MVSSSHGPAAGGRRRASLSLLRFEYYLAARRPGLEVRGVDALGLTPIPYAQSCDPSTSRPIPLMLWLAVGHSVSAVPLQGPFCHHQPAPR